jgi:hypothetical protein
MIIIQDLFTGERLRKFAESDACVAHFLKGRSHEDGYLEAIFNSEVASDTAMLHAFCAANGLTLPTELTLLMGDEPVAYGDTVGELVIAWETIRTRHGLGSRDTPRLIVQSLATGEPVVEISYNGCVWQPGRVGEKVTFTVTHTHAHLDPSTPTIANVLAKKLEREPTQSELCAEVRRILLEAAAERSPTNSRNA